ncbi:MAG: DUF3365 domain-containing protein [Oleibacter sp.]|nr:DUF3365 domain-containing protein [Thalassolituus sp.]
MKNLLIIGVLAIQCISTNAFAEMPISSTSSSISSDLVTTMPAAVLLHSQTNSEIKDDDYEMSQQVNQSEKDTARLIMVAQDIVRTFGTELKVTLVGKMKTEGPVAAIQVCNVKAPIIAEKYSSDGWDVGRTSTKLRNTSNYPDEWENAILDQFAAQLTTGVDIDDLEVSAIMDGEYRYMKAIAMDGPCLICHGENLSPVVAKEISRLYPQDKAIEYKLGEMRGAFTLRFKL